MYADEPEGMPYVAILSESGELLLENEQRPFGDSVSLDSLRGGEEGSFTMKLDGENYIVNRLFSGSCGWTYLSLVPERVLYQLPTQLAWTLCLVLTLCFILGLLLVLQFTSRSYRQMQNIMELFRAAEEGRPLPTLSERGFRDEYSILTDNLVKTFVEQRYMKLALSERLFRTKTLELLALQAQINPHFLFNTLKTVYWKSCSLTDGPNDVSRMVEALSGILSYSLGNPHEMVTVREELAQTRNYLDIQMIRYRDKFDTVFQCDESLLDEKILRLILQPVLENSIYHGIKEKEGRSVLRIRLKRHDSTLRFTVTDTGLGMTRKTLAELQARLTGSVQPEQELNHIGLVNTVKRLQLKYGGRAKVVVRSRYGTGTCVILELPLDHSEDAPCASEHDRRE